MLPTHPGLHRISLIFLGEKGREEARIILTPRPALSASYLPTPPAPSFTQHSPPLSLPEHREVPLKSPRHTACMPPASYLQHRPRLHGRARERDGEEGREEVWIFGTSAPVVPGLGVFMGGYLNSSFLADVFFFSFVSRDMLSAFLYIFECLWLCY